MSIPPSDERFSVVHGFQVILPKPVEMIVQELHDAIRGLADQLERIEQDVRDIARHFSDTP